MSRTRRELLTGLALWLCLACCYWIYSPGVSGPFLLDDRVNLAGLEVLVNGVEFVPDVVLGNTSGPLGRPVAMLSLSGSWLAAGGLDPSVFKTHNLALHLIGGALVCWFALILLSALRVHESELIAVMSAAHWLLSPLMLSTVLYVIQRMAQAACVFVLLALICYGKARLATRPTQAAALAAMTVVLMTLAIFSKESAVVAVPLLLLFEFTVFRPSRPSIVYAVLEKAVVTVIIAASALLMLSAFAGWLSDGILSYRNRDFTLWERSMTQFRVILDYVVGLFWPLKGGYGLYHDDFPISRGLLSPPQTLAAAVIVFTALFLAVAGVVRSRLKVFSIGVLFFLLGHSAESTLFPLEIYFEHRNYLPAVGLCIGLSWCVVMLARKVPELRTLLLIAFAGFILLSAGSTGLRASYWSSSELFSALSLTEHPQSPRANVAYGTVLARAGDPALGAGYVRFAGRLLKDPAAVKSLREIWLYCVAGVAPPEILLRQLEADINGFGNARIDEALDAVVRSVLDGQCDRSVGMYVADSIGRFRNAGGRLTARASGLTVKLENFLGRYQNAILYADDMVDRDSRSTVGNMMLAYLADQLGYDDRRDNAISKLRQIDCEGGLSLEQRASLATFAKFEEKKKCGNKK